MTPPIKYKLVKPTRSRFWLVRLAEPCSEGWQERSTKETRRREAERFAAQLVSGIQPHGTQRLTWAAFRQKYEAEHLPTLKRPGCFKSAAAKLEAVCPAKYIDQLDAPHLKRWRQQMLAAGMRPATVTSYVKHVRASLGWAAENGYLTHAPRVRAGSTATMKGRPLTGEEFDRLLGCVRKVVDRPYVAAWQRLLRGLWLMGLRLQEAIDMRWDDPAAIHPVRLEKARPMLMFPGSQQKNGKDQLIPLTPDAAAFLLETPAKRRVGRVFPLPGSRRAVTTADRASRVISEIGSKAKIVTKIDPETGAKQHATAHDLRRSFASRLMPKVLPAMLRELMRHADIKTTMAHYAQADAEQMANQLWAALEKPEAH